MLDAKRAQREYKLSRMSQSGVCEIHEDDEGPWEETRDHLRPCRYR